MLLIHATGVRENPSDSDDLGVYQGLPEIPVNILEGAPPTGCVAGSVPRKGHEQVLESRLDQPWSAPV